MGRRRYTCPAVKKTRAKRPRWHIRAQVPVLVSRGVVESQEKPYYFGFCDEQGKRAAEKQRDELLKTINKTPTLIQSQAPFADVAKAWQETVLPSYKESTRRTYESRLTKWILPTFGTLRLGDIDKLAVQRWVYALADAGKGHSHRSVSLALLRSIFCAAEDWGYLDRNPARRIKLGDDGKVRNLKPLDPGEVSKLLAVTPEPYHTMAYLAVFTGLRIGEVLALSWAEINLSDGTARVVASKTQTGHLGTPKTKRGVRTVVLDDALISMLAALRPADGSGLVWPAGDYQRSKVALTKAAKAIGIKFAGFGWHTLRRTYATLMAEILPDLPAELVGAMGHSQSRMTERYVTRGQSRQRAAIGVMRGMIDGPVASVVVM